MARGKRQRISDVSADEIVEQTPPSAKGIKVPLNDEGGSGDRRQTLGKTTMLAQIQRKRMSLGTPGAPGRVIDEAAGEEMLVAAQSHVTPQSQRTPRYSIGPLGVDGKPLITPLKRAPLVVNFEEWMKMANDNKINATNSWNFALIDYFHDMSLLKEGDSVNFQKASCTLDGCVKIYTSRVDSVATETGKLLSGLADSNSDKKKRGEDGENGGASDEEEDEEGNVRKKRKRTQRSAESTLAKDFSALSLKKFELEFTVDPLFKKASADFDEGGAKGLLLNHLAIDGKGRIVFDSSDDVQDGGNAEHPEGEPQEPEDYQENCPDVDIDMLREKFFPNLDIIDEQDVCASLKTFDLGDPAGSLDIPFLKQSDIQNDEDDHHDDDHDMGPMVDFGDDDLGLPGADGTMAFGEGGEAWANEALAVTEQRIGTPMRSGSAAPFEADQGDGELLGVGLGVRRGQHEEILAYFDEALKKNWAGPEHWRIRRIKDSSSGLVPKEPTVRKPRKEKEEFQIDFLTPAGEVTDDMLLPKSSASINLPKSQWISKTRNLLPDDRHFNSKNLLKLFLKPNSIFGSRGSGKGLNSSRPKSPEPHVMDEKFWAKQQERALEAPSSPQAAAANYDANFFQDDDGLPMGGFDDDDDEVDQFADARDHFSPPPEGMDMDMGAATQNATQFPFFNTQDFGSQLITTGRKVRPDYVQYAKVAKKVDVRKLKENIWNELDLKVENAASTTPAGSATPAPEPPKMKFTEVVNSLQKVYPKQAMADISTSYCFICVLHLANEKGLVIKGNETLTDLEIEKDPTAPAVGDGY